MCQKASGIVTMWTSIPWWLNAQNKEITIIQQENALFLRQTSEGGNSRNRNLRMLIVHETHHLDRLERIKSQFCVSSFSFTSGVNLRHHRVVCISDGGTGFLYIKKHHFVRSYHHTLRRNFLPFRNMQFKLRKQIHNLLSKTGNVNETPLCFGMTFSYSYTIYDVPNLS